MDARQMSDYNDPVLAEVLQLLAGNPGPVSRGYGFRYNSTQPKGQGFLGPLQRPDGGVMSEYSVGMNVGGHETELPSIVPTLTREELLAILQSQEGTQLPASVFQKARAYAEQRLKNGQSPFAAEGEQQNLYPDLQRAPVPPAQQTFQPMASHGASSVRDALFRLMRGQ